MVEFLYPYSFLLLVFLVLFFKKSAEFNLNPKIIANKQSLRFKKYILVLAYICLVVALARPVTDKKEINTHMNIKKVVLALDISRSMLASDVYPNRLTFAKHKMEQFIDKFNGEIAIMAFSNTAFLISPYTSDKDTLKYLLNNIDTSYITSSGTDFENLINTAKKMGYTDLVVFSDGGDVKKLDTKGINLYVLLIGNKPSPIKLKNGELLSQNGKIVMVGINKDILKFAKFGRVATNTDSDIKSLISQNFAKVENNKKVVVYKELFIYPLALAVVLLFMGFFSLPKKLLPVVLLFTIQAKAGILDWYYLDKAKEAYNQGNYQKSYEVYSKFNNDEAKFNAADSLYKMKKYKQALKLYSEIKDKKLKEKSLYNQGNCYAKMGKIDEAIKSYEESLKINPNDKDAKYNLELLKKHKKNNKNDKNKKQNQQNKKKNSKKQDKQNKNNQNNQNKSQKNSENKNKKNDKQQNNHKQNKVENKPKQTQQKKNNTNQKNKSQNQKQNIKVQPIQIKPQNSTQIFNKIKSQTLMVPLSKGESKNEW